MLQNVQFTQNTDGVNVNIAVNEQFNGVTVTNISMYVNTVSNDSYFYDGDLAVNWDTEGLSNNEAADTAGNLLLRNMHSDDDITNVMGMFYWDDAFTERLREILVAHGFSKEAAEYVHTSEWGMQDIGRASYDANDIADEVRKHFNIAVAA